jgi:hypothetical protein
MKKYELTIVSEFESVSSFDALTRLRDTLIEIGASMSGLKNYGKSVRFDDENSLRKQLDRPTFDIEGPEYDFSLARIANHRIDTMLIKSDQSENWDKWIANLAIGEGFTMAWLADAQYQYWQNATDPLQYDAKGIGHDHLPKKSNGLPPPLEQMCIDISENPGRRILREGYVEAVGSPMWLSANFWALTGATPDNLAIVPGLQLENRSSGIVKLLAWSGCFDTGQGESFNCQTTLRSRLYPSG